MEVVLAVLVIRFTTAKETALTDIVENHRISVFIDGIFYDFWLMERQSSSCIQSI